MKPWNGAWRSSAISKISGRIPWSAVDRGALLFGPPDTGKTTFATALAGSARVPLVSGSLGEWQSAGHLGDLLKAMRATFAAARSAIPAILFIDELDSFGSRASLSRDHRDYGIQVINGLFELMDGIGGREGVVIVGACNHPQRLDPAIVRSGRLDRHLPVPLPNRQALREIFRIHLGNDLSDTDLSCYATSWLAGPPSRCCWAMCQQAPVATPAVIWPVRPQSRQPASPPLVIGPCRTKCRSPIRPKWASTALRRCPWS